MAHELGERIRGRPTASERDRWRDSLVIDESSRADRLGIVDTVDREQVESFLAATDFENETVYVEMVEVEECFRLNLCHINWTSTEISTDYTRRSRPYTERCAVEELVIEARFIRIQDVLEASEVNGYSSSVGTGACDRRQGRTEGEEDAAPASASERTTRTGTGMADSRGTE